MREIVENPMVLGNDYSDEIVGHCDVCGEELLDGTDVYEMPDGSIICRETDCLLKWSQAEKRTITIGGLE